MLGPVVAGAIGLGVCVTAGLVDPTGGPVLCPFLAATGLYCPGCGATRMMHRLMVGDPVGALHLNPLAFVLIPLMAWWSYAGLTAMLGGPRWPTPRFTARQTGAAGRRGARVLGAAQYPDESVHVARSRLSRADRNEG